LIQADNIQKTKEKLNEILAHHTGKPVDVVTADTERDNFMDAEASKEYGLVDEVLTSRELLKA
jgi:ATP-dependent Clp protease protease subunit